MKKIVVQVSSEGLDRLRQELFGVNQALSKSISDTALVKILMENLTSGAWSVSQHSQKQEIISIIKEVLTDGQA